MPKPLASTFAALTAVLCAQAQVAVTTPNLSLKAGVLLQPQYESAGSGTLEGDSQNLFLRRARLIVLGTIGNDLEVFVQTDAPNDGKTAADGSKTWNSFVLQDAVMTYKFSNETKLDAGLLVPLTSHMGLQGAATLNGLDYATYAFQSSAMLNTNGARDTGVRLRTLLNKGMFDVQVGAYQGKRDKATPVSAAAPDATNRVQSRNPLRMAGRVQVNFFDAETGLYYSGTYFGAKKIFSVGITHDRQGDYKATAEDVFLDWPLGEDVVTFQADRWTYEGTGFWLLPKQNDLFAEGSYRFGASKLAPLLRYEKKSMETANLANPDETRIGAGINWWFKNHTSNLKVYWQRVKPEAPGVSALHAYNQMNLQWQLFYF